MHWQDFSVFGDCDYLFEGGDVCEMCRISGSIIFLCFRKRNHYAIKAATLGFSFFLPPIP